MQSKQQELLDQEWQIVVGEDWAVHEYVAAAMKL
jgi:hypothetical protein